MKKSHLDRNGKPVISSPCDMRHLNHIGWDPFGELEVNMPDEDRENLLRLAGISTEPQQISIFPSRPSHAPPSPPPRHPIPVLAPIDTDSDTIINGKTGTEQPLPSDNANNSISGSDDHVAHTQTTRPKELMPHYVVDDYSTENVHTSQTLSFPTSPVAVKKKIILGRNGKPEISSPSDMRHLNHIGWDPNVGFEVNMLDEDRENLLRLAGISTEPRQISNFPSRPSHAPPSPPPRHPIPVLAPIDTDSDTIINGETGTKQSQPSDDANNNTSGSDEQAAHTQTTRPKELMPHHVVDDDLLENVHTSHTLSFPNSPTEPLSSEIYSLTSTQPAEPFQNATEYMEVRVTGSQVTEQHLNKQTQQPPKLSPPKPKPRSRLNKGRLKALIPPTKNRLNGNETTQPLADGEKLEGSKSDNNNNNKDYLAKVVRDFQTAYFKRGADDFKEHEQHLEKLADHYYKMYTSTQSWSDSFKAFSLYNSAAVDYDASPQNEWNTKAWAAVHQCLGDHLKVACHDFYLSVDRLHKVLLHLRLELRSKVNELDRHMQTNSPHHSNQMQAIILHSNNLMRDFAKLVIKEAIHCMKHQPPCDFSTVGIGSIGRGEATPFSDLEYIFLIEDANERDYFERLAVLSYFLIGALRETNLKSIGITELDGWFVDKRRKGFQIDGITDSSGNVPTGSESRPNSFIVTKHELSQRYEQVLNNPDPEESLRGDLTAMMAFATLIHTTQERETLFRAFKLQKQQLNGSLTALRVKSNLKMFESDLTKFLFSAEYDLYSLGFSLDVKRLLYRFPSIILQDLVLIFNRSKIDSWQTLNSWGGNRRAYSNNRFHAQLFSLLAVACYSRLRCYLFMDSCLDHFTLDTTNSDSNFVKDGQQRILRFVQSQPFWKMARDEFYQIAMALITLQQHFLSEEDTLSSNFIRDQVDTLVVQTMSGACLAHFFSCEWPMVIAKLQPDFHVEKWLYNNSPSSAYMLVFANALAFSFLQCRQYKQSIRQYLAIMNTMDQSGDVKADFSANYGIAKCYYKMGEMKESQEAYKNAIKMCGVSIRDHTEHVSSARKWKSYNMDTGMALFELGLLYAKTGLDIQQALALMFKAAKYFILAASTNGGGIHLLQAFDSLPYLERLDYISSPTRVLAHCVFSIAELFDAINHGHLAKEYYGKARSLGLMMVVDQQQEGLTKVAVLNDLGSRFKIPKYIDGAKKMLQQLAVTDSSKQLECDLLLSEGESLTFVCPQKPAHPPKQPELENEVDQFIDMLSGDAVNRSEAQWTGENITPQSSPGHKVEAPIVETWFHKTKTALESLYKDSYHVDIARAHKIRGDLAGSMNQDSQAIEYYSKAGDYYKHNGVKIQQASVHQVEANLHQKANDFELAERIFGDAQGEFESAYDGLCENYPLQLANVKIERAYNLKALKKDSLAQKLEREGHEIKQNAEEMREKAAHAVEVKRTHNSAASKQDTLTQKLDLVASEIESEPMQTRAAHAVERERTDNYAASKQDTLTQKLDLVAQEIESESMQTSAAHAVEPERTDNYAASKQDTLTTKLDLVALEIESESMQTRAAHAVEPERTDNYAASKQDTLTQKLDLVAQEIESESMQTRAAHAVELERTDNYAASKQDTLTPKLDLVAPEIESESMQTRAAHAVEPERTDNYAASKQDTLNPKLDLVALEIKSESMQTRAPYAAKKENLSISKAASADETPKSVDSVMFAIRQDIMDVDSSKLSDLEKQIMEVISKFKTT